MEKISFCFLALLLVVLSFVPQTHQYGTVFVDTVVPVKESFVNFDRTVSDIVNTTTALVGGVRLSDPAGFNVTLTNPIDVITNGTLSLKGELGFILGNVNTTETSISANQTLNFMSQEFFSLFNNVRFNFSDEISFTSAAQIRAFADRVIDFEGVNGVVVSSERGNIGITSPEFFASSNIVTNIVSEDIRLASRTGYIDWTGEESIFISGDIVELYSAQSSEFLAYNNLVIYAEDAVQGFAANTLFSGLGDLSIGTNRTIDITTPNGFYLTARTMNFVSQDQITLNHREEDISSMTVLANNRVFVQAFNSSLISDSIIARTFGSQKIIANQWLVEAEENINIGTEETKNVIFDAGYGIQSLNFTLSQRNTTFPFGAPPNSGDELRLTARNVNFTAATQVIFQAQEDIRSLASSVTINTSTNFNVTAGGDFNVYRTANDLTPGVGTLQTARGTVIGAARDVISEAILLSVSTNTSLVQAGGDLTSYSTNALFVNNLDAPASGSVTVTGVNNYFKAGDALFTATSLSFNGGNTADATLSFALDVSIRANGYASIVTTRDNSFETQQGDLVIDSATSTITALQSGVSFSSAEDVYFDVYANLTVTSGGDIAFTNEGNYTEFEAVAEAPSLELTFDETITFSAADQHLFNVNGTLLFDAGRNITAQATDNFAADAGSIVLISYGSGIGSGIIANNTGVNGTISFNSTGFTGFTAGFLSFTADSFAISGNSSGFTASEELNILIGDDINGNITGAYRVNSDGHVFLEALAFTLIHNGTAPVAFTARDSLNITTDGQIGLIGANIDLRAGQFDLLTERIDIASNNWFVQAGNRVAIRSLNETFYSIGGDLLETAPVIRHVSDEVVTFAGSIVSINGTELVEFVSRQFIVQDFVNWELTSDEFFLYSEEFQAFLEFNVTGELILRAQNEVVLSSEQDLYFTSSTGGFFALATTNLTVLSDDSIYLAAEGSLVFANNQTFANGTSQNVIIQSGGSTRIGSFATGNSILASAADIAVDGGRLTFTSFGTNGTTLISNFGAMTFESEAGSFRLDSASSILLNATNELTTGSHYFLASNGVEMRTVDGGLFFDSQGVLEDGATAIEFVSTSTYGDIVFESEYGLLFLDALNTVDLNAGVDNTLHAAHGASFIADNRTSITATQGRFSAHGQRGVTINAGQALDNADVVFDSPQGYFHLTTADQITLTSTGVIPNNQPAILVSAQSDIRQVTGNTGNITALASGKLTFNATGDFYVNSTNNMVFNSTAGSLNLLAQDAILFQTLGGPLLFSTVTGSPDGDILLSAGGASGSLNFFAGNTTTFFARGEMVVRTATGGILASTLDGSLDLLAESSSSVVRFLSAGGISVVSDSRTNLDDELTGIVLDSANNIVYGSANLPTTAVRFNARDHVVVGDTTRPLITFNAGGSAQQSGLTITSVGGISTRSEGVINAQIGQDYVVNTQFGIRSVSEGPTILQNTSPTGKFTLTSDQGNTRLYGGELLNIVSGDSILTSSEGALDLISTGLQFTDGITFAAPKVDITSGTTQFQAKMVDADLTASFNLLTTGDATIQGAQDANSDFRFVAGAAFNGTSAGRVEISSTESQGGVLFNTKQAGSVISIVSDFQSDIGFVSAGALNMVAGVYSLSASEVSIVAADRDGNSDGSLADITIGAENNFSTISGEDLQLLAQRNLLIETVDTVNDIGSPLQVTATGDLTVNAADEFTIQTVAGQQGSINFVASTSININGAFVSVQADELLQVNTVGNYRLEGKQFEQRVDGVSNVIANSTDRNDRFGVHFEVDSATATTTFEALFGSVRFNSLAANVAITSNKLVLDTRGDGRMIGAAGFTYTTTSTDTSSGRFDAGSASVNMYGFTGIEYTSTGPTDGIVFSAGGIDSSSNFAVRFEADSTSPIVINSDNFFSETFNGALLRGETVDINTNAFTANGIEIELSSQVLTNITAPAISLFAKLDIHSESGSFFINGESTLNFETTSGDIMIATHGGNATIDLYSSGSFIVEAVTINLATERRPSADLNLLSTLGRMEFTSSLATTVVNGVQPNPYTLSILADSGSVRIAATNDDGDIYIVSPTLDFEASGDLIVSSQLGSGTISGLSFITEDAAVINAQSTIHFSDGRGPATQPNTPNSLIQAPNVNFNAEGAHGVGGAINIDLTNGAFTATNQLTISAPQADAKVVFASEFGQTQITADTLFISNNSKMLIPYRNEVSFACDTDQNFFYTDTQLVNGGTEYEDSGYVCVCNGGALRCIELRENIPGQTRY